MIRTTITLPEDLYEKLRLLAFSQRKSFSEIIRARLITLADRKQVKTGAGISALLKLGSYAKAGQKYKFSREKFYDEIIKHKLSFGH